MEKASSHWGTDLIYSSEMTLTKDDVQTIQGLLAEQMQGIEQRFTEFRRKVKSMFQEQADSLSRATAEAVKLRADKQRTDSYPITRLRAFYAV